MFKLKSCFKNINAKNVLFCIDRIKIKYNTVLEIINLFKYKNLIVIVDLEKNSKLFSKFENENIKYNVFSLGKNNAYVETILIISNKNINILNDIINENIEELYIFSDEVLYNLDEIINYDEYVNWKKKCNPNLYIEFIFKENEINVSYNAELYTGAVNIKSLLLKNKKIERDL